MDVLFLGIEVCVDVIDLWERDFGEEVFVWLVGFKGFFLFFCFVSGDDDSDY